MSIRHAAQKATDGDHEQAAAVLRDSVRNLLTPAAEKALRSVLAEKDSIAYQGRYYPLEQGLKVMTQAGKFAKWARAIFENGV